MEESGERKRARRQKVRKERKWNKIKRRNLNKM